VEVFVDRVRQEAKTGCENLVAAFLHTATPDEMKALKQAVKGLLRARREKPAG
jgi:hypothetical protein